MASLFGRVEVLPQTGCWMWRGSFSTNGYPVLSAYGFTTAHRAMFAWFVGDVPEGYDLDHLCRVRACINPAHLEAVTKSENLRRAVISRGMCRNGHLWIPENLRTWTTKAGKFVTTCKICSRRKVA